MKKTLKAALLSATLGVVSTLGVGAAALTYSPGANAWVNPFGTICGETMCCSTEPTGSCWPKGKKPPQSEE